MINLSVFLMLFSGEHLLLILAAFLFLFGGKKIPEMMKGIGQGIKEFKKAVRDEPEAPESKREVKEPQNSLPA
jgi:sec-independent protein translocase protein TatA